MVGIAILKALRTRFLQELYLGRSGSGTVKPYRKNRDAIREGGHGGIKKSESASISSEVARLQEGNDAFVTHVEMLQHEKASLRKMMQSKGTPTREKQRQ